MVLKLETSVTPEIQVSLKYWNVCVLSRFSHVHVHSLRPHGP